MGRLHRPPPTPSSCPGLTGASIFKVPEARRKTEFMRFSGGRLKNRRISAPPRRPLPPSPLCFPWAFPIGRLGAGWGSYGAGLWVLWGFSGGVLGVRSPETPKAGQVRPFHIPPLDPRASEQHIDLDRRSQEFNSNGSYLTGKLTHYTLISLVKYAPSKPKTSRCM